MGQLIDTGLILLLRATLSILGLITYVEYSDSMAILMISMLLTLFLIDSTSIVVIILSDYFGVLPLSYYSNILELSILCWQFRFFSFLVSYSELQVMYIL